MTLRCKQCGNTTLFHAILKSFEPVLVNGDAEYLQPDELPGKFQDDGEIGESFRCAKCNSDNVEEVENE